MATGLGPDTQKAFERAISWAKSTLKKEDRIIWFLRIYKASLLRDEAIMLKRQPEEYRNALKRYEKSQRILLKNGFDVKEYFEDPTGNPGPVLDRLRNGLRHFMGIRSPKIQNFKFDWQSPDTIFQTFKVWEDEWKEFSKGSIPYDEEDQHTEVLPFPDGKVWLNLNKTSCDLEADAMGHCGNEGGNESETILSLRTKDDKNQRWIVHLTFTYNKNTGKLIEMKGRGNNKPSEKYHKYIIQLLKMDFIKGITGGGYLPENNFDIHDLQNEKTKESLLVMKPQLEKLTKRLRKDPPDNEALKEFLEIHSYDLDDVLGTSSYKIKDNKIYLIFDNAHDFIEKYGGHFAKWSSSIVSGDEFLETFDAAEHISGKEIFEDLDPEVQENLKNIYQERTSQNPDEDPEDFFSTFSAFFTQVTQDSLQMSYEGNIYKGLINWLETKDLGDPIIRELTHEAILEIHEEDILAHNDPEMVFEFSEMQEVDYAEYDSESTFQASQSHDPKESL